MESTILTLALTIIREVVRNPKKKARLRSLMMKIKDAIDVAFAESLRS